MTEWDRLWDGFKVADHGYVIRAEWALAVKAEGDKLQTKLEAIRKWAHRGAITDEAKIIKILEVLGDGS